MCFNAEMVKKIRQHILEARQGEVQNVPLRKSVAYWVFEVYINIF